MSAERAEKHHDDSYINGPVGGPQVPNPGNAELKAMITELLAFLKGGGDPGAKLLKAIYVLLPNVLHEREDRIKDLADLLNLLSDVSNAASQLQGDFNECHNGGKPIDPKLKAKMEKDALHLAALIAKLQGTGKFDDTTINSLVDAFKQATNGGDISTMVDTWVKLWKQSDSDFADSSAQLKIKSILDGFSKTSQTAGSVSSQTQASLGFETEQYKQLEATFKNIMGSEKDMTQAPVDAMKRQ